MACDMPNANLFVLGFFIGGASIFREQAAYQSLQQFFMMPNPNRSALKCSGTYRYRRQQAFTIVELIAVMIVVGIMAAVATPRFFEREQFDGRAFADQTVGMLRYGQKLAIAQNRPVFVRLNGASVALCFTAACVTVSDRVLPPAGANSGSVGTLAACANATAWLCEGLPNKITYVVGSSAAVTVPPTPVVTDFYFNALGRPFAAADTEPVSTFPPSMTITINGASPARVVVVESETGYVHL
jgi:MSHA pilin protein MshC